jgi:cytochrome c oxidase subunit 2
MIVFTALTISVNPPSNVERIDPKTLHLSGEFAEHNLGTTVAADGSVTTRVVATQFMFVPRCIAVPQGRRVTLRFSTPDVIHGLLITGTNVNTMVVPGYVAQVHTEFTRSGDLLMPCHEYCGIGHSEMWATVQVLQEGEFKPDSEGKVSCAQR